METKVILRKGFMALVASPAGATYLKKDEYHLVSPSGSSVMLCKACLENPEPNLDDSKIDAFVAGECLIHA